MSLTKNNIIEMNEDKKVIYKELGEHVLTSMAYD